MSTYDLETLQRDIDLIADRPSIEHIFAFEDAIKQAVAKGYMPPRDFDLEHYFADGLYGRQILMPRGSLLTGKVHRQRHMSVMVGNIIVCTERGMEHLTGWNVLVSEPGIKRVGLVLDDTVWITIHGTHETDLAKIEAEVIIPEDEARKPLLEGGAS